MILYFSATGNSLAVARQLAERLNEQLMPLMEAVQQDLTGEKRIGLVFPTYDFNLPPGCGARYDSLPGSESDCGQVYRLWHLCTCLPDGEHSHGGQ